jgi:hypothetical protein
LLEVFACDMYISLQTTWVALNHGTCQRACNAFLPSKLKQYVLEELSTVCYIEGWERSLACCLPLRQWSKTHEHVQSASRGMVKSMGINIETALLRIVHQIAATHLPSDAAFHLFGPQQSNFFVAIYNTLHGREDIVFDLTNYQRIA